MKRTLRFGVLGLGNAGQLHIRALLAGQVPGAELRAIAGRSAAEGLPGIDLPDHVHRCASLAQLLATRSCDAVIIATPHPAHPEQTIAALEAGLHVLCEKPAGICAREAREMAAAAARHGRLYALNLNRRTNPAFARLREVTRSGILGELRRISWTSTNWLRLQSYYESSPWRGTWRGEGGGMFLNQLPHALDLWQWICGMPQRLRAFCRFGRHHEIEVEDEATVYAEYANGASAVFTASTGEAPGTERIELIGDRGRAVLEDQRTLTVQRTATPVREFIRTQPAGFGNPEYTREITTFEEEGDLVAGITRDFTQAARYGTPLLAPGAEGVSSLDLANAILLSSWRDHWVELPCPEEEYERELERRRTSSRLRVPAARTVMHLEDSFR